MQSDKAFLEYGGRPFVSLVAEKALCVSPEVLVVIGRKEKAKFESALPRSVGVMNDTHNLGSPLGGMLTAFEVFGTGYALVLACDMPFVRADVLRLMCDSAISHSAAIPRWESGKVEPLCSVYDVKEVGAATRKAIRSGGTSCRSMISLLTNVNYVPVSVLRTIDPSLGSLINLNTRGDLRALDVPEHSRDKASDPRWTAPLQSSEEA